MSELLVDLQAMLRVSDSFLPAVADAYESAATTVGYTGLFENGMHGVDDCFTTDARGPWTELRDQIFSILKECGSNAREAADALRNIADSYATGDQLNADELSQYEQYKVELIMDDHYYTSPQDINEMLNTPADGSQIT